MLSRSLLKRLITSNSRAYCSAVEKSAITANYDASEMPDKLYKTIELELKSAEPAVMKSYEKFVRLSAGHLGITVGEVWDLRKPNYQRKTLLKSVFVHRKHLVQYEIRTHYKWMQLHKLTGSTADTFLEYIERMLPEGVALKVTKISIEPLPSHLTPEEVQGK